jgi:hypothetical protein
MLGRRFARRLFCFERMSGPSILDDPVQETGEERQRRLGEWANLTVNQALLAYGDRATQPFVQVLS